MFACNALLNFAWFLVFLGFFFCCCFVLRLVFEEDRKENERCNAAMVLRSLRGGLIQPAEVALGLCVLGQYTLGAESLIHQSFLRNISAQREKELQPCPASALVIGKRIKKSSFINLCPADVQTTRCFHPPLTEGSYSITVLPLDLE